MAARVRRSCYVCNTQFRPISLRHITGINVLEKQEIAVRFHGEPRMLLENFHDGSRLCINCHLIVGKEFEFSNDPNCIKLNVLRSCTALQCFICREDGNVHTLSTSTGANIFMDNNIYVPENVGVCTHHLNSRGFVFLALTGGLLSSNKFLKIEGVTLQNFLTALRDFSLLKPSDVADADSLTDDEFSLISPISKDQFNEKLTFCDGERAHRYVNDKDLLIFLCE
ncbi:hypothetical protein HHI36_010985 [Cryptolaemus montrouzieri]|uniref:Uncharacterized protein n=1 Tax=Cryptolaemus montrouzieri TaxID=559131 RepID=A0ABD2MKQ1_9CUCU